MYIRPLKCTSCYCYVLCPEKNVIIQICYYLGVGYSKIQYSFCTKKKKVTSHLIRWKSIGLHGNQISQSNTFYYAHPDFLKVIQILACPGINRVNNYVIKQNVFHNNKKESWFILLKPYKDKKF